MPEMDRRISPAMILLAAAASATAGFALISGRVAEHRTAHFDGQARRKFPRRRRRVTKKLARAIGPLGKEWVHGPVAALAAFYLWREGRPAAAGAVVASSAVSAGLSHLFEIAMPLREPPPGRHSPTEPSFPSGHSLETMTVALTIAYVLTREDLVDGRVALPIAVAVPVISGLGRLYLDRHWATDVLAGWLAGCSLAAGAAALYEATAD